MFATRPYGVAQLGVLLLVLSGCQTLPSSPPRVPAAELAPAAHTLTLIVSELQMHLHDDTYRTTRAITADGRNVFAMAHWRIQRAQELRALEHEQWENVDIVLEYARARALERMRRYAKAERAYEAVANAGSLMAEPAAAAADVMRRFARYAGGSTEPISAADDELAFLNGRLESWRDLAWDYRATSYEVLALEEAEAWEILRVDWLKRNRSISKAIGACRRLVERNHESKLYAQHLIRLGDLYADAARRVHLLSRAKLAPFDANRYETLLDQAFSAYELAGEERKPGPRREAQMKIEALLAVHQGTFGHAQ